MDDRFGRFLRTAARRAGRRFEEARRAYRDGLTARDAAGTDGFDLPRDDEGRARIVCRRHVERRAVHVDEDGHPSCFDPEHPDCRGCVEDVREGVVETW